MMKYRTIESGGEEIFVITEDGGLACIMDKEGCSEDEKRLSSTEYYQERFTQEMLDAEESIFEQTEMCDGKMYWADWETPYTNPDHVQDALEWLCVGCEFELDETIWEDF